MKAVYNNQPQELRKYIEAQNAAFGSSTMYENALEEIRGGSKEGHWIWYIWPQIEGLGHSIYCIKYGIPGLEGACVYLNNDILRGRLIEITEALLELDTDDLLTVMWQVDCMKVRSSATLFYLAAVRLWGENSKEAELFMKVIRKYFHRVGFCELTLQILADHGEITERPKLL